MLIIGRQVATDHGGYIDLLAIDEDGDLAIIELKRDRTPREIVAQVLDYASWTAELAPKRIHELADEYLGRQKKGRLRDAFRDHFGRAPPENLNSTHSMFVVASAFDESSKRIVEYLAKRHGLEINTAFFNFFRDGSSEFMTADWLMDQDEVRERSEAKTKAPWSGVWYVNVSEGPHRSWEDARKYGFVAAGGGPRWSDPLKRLSVGDRIYAYLKGHGYVGAGSVVSPVAKAKDFKVNGKPLLGMPLAQPNMVHDQDDDERAEYVVGVKWDNAVPVEKAKTFDGVFANQHIVCKLRDEQTLEFLKREFAT